MTINPITIGAICHRTGVPVDYDFSSVVALGHMEDEGGSPISPRNSCPRGTNFVLHGAASIANTSPLFGNGCLNLTGAAGCFLESGTSSDYNISGAYTIEFAMKTSTPLQTAFIYAVDKTATIGYITMIIAGGAFQPRESNVNMGGGGTVATSTWQRVAIAHHTGGAANTQLYIDGVLTGSAWTGGSLDTNSIRLGADFRFGSFLFSGQIDEFRLTNGVERYTSTYTPTTQAFPDS